MIQAASDSGNAGALVFFLFDLLYLDGEVISAAPLLERKERLRGLISGTGTPLEGIISKRADVPYSPGDRGLWVKVKCQNREEFVVVGWTDPEGARPWFGALLMDRRKLASSGRLRGLARGQGSDRDPVARILRLGAQSRRPLPQALSRSPIAPPLPSCQPPPPAHAREARSGGHPPPRLRRPARSRPSRETGDRGQLPRSRAAGPGGFPRGVATR